MENNMQLGINHIDKLDFLEAYPKARMEAFKSENIKNGFAATGLVPFQPDRVLLQLNIQLKTPILPRSRASTIPTNWVPETPHNIIELQHQAATIKALLKWHMQSPLSPTNAALNQLIKGCQLAMNIAVILAKENRDLWAANKKQKQKCKRSTNQVSHEGGLTVQEAQDLVQNQILDQNQMAEGVAAPAAEAASAPRTRAPPKCTNCGTIGHIRTRCPNCSNS
ncbi:hypothetical protein VTN77DRAFT_6480 [Rasamsonia byssochlamydoides]|uniref:uncharacterized protein n=1 Tax=Rasamsonia byssochlamydoides TaxID=89139 RepID=UPI0037442D1A